MLHTSGPQGQFQQASAHLRRWRSAVGLPSGLVFLSCPLLAALAKVQGVCSSISSLTGRPRRTPAAPLVFNVMFSKSYRCRDCGEVCSPAKPTNRCPACGSIYLLRNDMRASRNTGKLRVTLSERFLSLILGAFFGLLTFIVWGVAILLHGGPVASKAAAGAMFIGLKLSIALSLVVGIAGFILGQEKLARLLGVLWGTDEELNESLDRIDERLRSVVLDVPNWLVYAVLGFVVVGAYGYMSGKL